MEQPVQSWGSSQTATLQAQEARNGAWHDHSSAKIMHDPDFTDKLPYTGQGVLCDQGCTLGSSLLWEC